MIEHTRSLSASCLALLWFAFLTASTLLATPAKGQGEEALFIVRGTRYFYGFFGRYATVPPAIGPVAPPFQQVFQFPNGNTNRSITNQLDITTSGGNQIQVQIVNEVLLRAARLDGNDWGGGVDISIDVYLKGAPGTVGLIHRVVSGQVTAVRGGGAGTTHAAGEGVIAVVNNGSGEQTLPISIESTLGSSSTQPHPTRRGYHLAGSFSTGGYGFTFQSLDFCFPSCPQLLNFRSTSQITVTITAECLANACPPNNAGADWNATGVQEDNNCYNYAANNFSPCVAGDYSNTASDPGGSPLPVFVNPDGTCVGLTCDIVAQRARADGLSGPFPDDGSCPTGTCLVYLVITQSAVCPQVGCDYHWYRRNADNSWSHKPGNTAARPFSPGNPPNFTDSCYTIPCGYFCVPCDARVVPRGSCPLPLQSFPVGAISNKSGRANPSFSIIEPAQIQAIASAIASGTPATPPAVLPGLGYSGLTVQGSDSTPELPAFTRFFNGLIHVHDAGGVHYLHDVADGYSYMRALALDAGLGRHFCGCVADVDNGDGNGVCDGGVTIEDLLYYLASFADGRPRADVDDGTGTGTTDGGVTIDDLLYFLVRFSNGC